MSLLADLGAYAGLTTIFFLVLVLLLTLWEAGCRLGRFSAGRSGMQEQHNAGISTLMSGMLGLPAFALGPDCEPGRDAVRSAARAGGTGSQRRGHRLAAASRRQMRRHAADPGFERTPIGRYTRQPGPDAVDESMIPNNATDAEKFSKVFCFFFSKKNALSFLKKRNKKLLSVRATKL